MSLILGGPVAANPMLLVDMQTGEVLYNDEGGQPWHPGSTLELVDHPNERMRHEPGRCGGCGERLADATEVGMQRRQVFDLPLMTVRMIEHQLIARRCACGATTCGSVR